MTYKGKSGKSYTTVEPAIGMGGEGSVYKISGRADCVLKAYNDKCRTETRHRKILAMIDSPMPPNAMKQVTWPMDVVYDGSGQFMGYVMPAVTNNEDLNVMYSDKYDCTLSEKITIAKNLCSAINAVHQANQVCGDLNPKNVSVDPLHALVTLVDTDSYHITDHTSKKIYRCVMGLPEYLPKEIQAKMKNGMDLANAQLPTFSKYSDLFALAVHIFALLMNGCHPFASAVGGVVSIGHLSNSQPSVVNPQPIDNICNDFFPFAMTKQGLTTPPYAPDFNMLPQKIQDLFKRAFISGANNIQDRPDTVEWYNALDNMQKNLKTCSINKRHMYPGHLQACPWCNVQAKTRQAMAAATVLTQTSINTNQQYIPPKRPVTQTTSAGGQGRYNVATGGYTKPVKPPIPLPIKVLVIGIAVVILVFFFKTCADALDHFGQSGSSSSIQSSQTKSVSSGYGSSNNASSEGDIYSSYKQIDVPPLEVNNASVDELSSNPTSVKVSDIATFPGNIAIENQMDDYPFIAPYDGYYRAELSGVMSDVSFRLYFIDDTGETVTVDNYCGNGEGITGKNLTAGRAYLVRVRQDRGYSPYNLMIGMQKPTVDITGYTSVDDSIEYEDQRNIYTFTPPIDGRYRFDMSQVMADTKFGLFVIDSLGETVTNDNYCANGDGVIAKDLKGGETYRIEVRQNTGYSSYTMKIGYQQGVTDISDLTSVSDSIEYSDQINVYSFTVPRDGRYRFELSGVKSGTNMCLYVINNLGETVANDSSCGNGEGITVKNLKAGDIYEVQVRQNREFSGYTLKIGKQKGTVEVEKGCIVNDSIEFSEQRNVYSYTADGSDLKLTPINMNGNMNVEVYVFNDLEESLASNVACSNKETVTVSNLTPGNHYEIQVRQGREKGPYSLIIK